MTQVTKSGIILPSDIRASIAMKEVARILTATEGTTSAEKNDEIFQTFFSVDSIKQGALDFFRKTTDPLAAIFDICVEHEGITDVLAAQREKTRWIFAVDCARVPREMYGTVTPQQALQQAGVATGIKLNQKYGFPVHHMYGDSRVFHGRSNTGNKNVNLLFLHGYKEQVGKYS
jgi:hypothetical protein